MSGISFGNELKKIRKSAGMSSKILSQKVNKAVTYVSQLERGLIKKPDFDTCKKILLELGFDEIEAIKTLNYFDIKSPEQEKAELDWTIKQAEIAYEEEESRYKTGFYTKKIEKISSGNELVLTQLRKNLDAFVTHDLSRAEKVVSNLNSIFKDEEKFDFFCSVFENDFSNLSSLERNKVLSMITNYVRKTNTDRIINSEEYTEEE
ncbi:Helix-turn-helix [Streptococcus pneumoniae]|uniref:helix-turn-helix domain-containing protein n=1 Tax=Bacillus paranthracis TaxID=2026186 RepID=UPI0005E5E8D2|nr:helix-turn-helix transcriptional regulator [Bacillus paranthracis]CKE81932.1 Helix-turn-helix [Bacillus paranthracis]CKF09632.1 Helix-turn-helix [Streptococcus pneumoniae]CKF36226.1 Helix-turn-helix [Streptococcus pneumoniae]